MKSPESQKQQEYFFSLCNIIDSENIDPKNTDRNLLLLNGISNKFENEKQNLTKLYSKIAQSVFKPIGIKYKPRVEIANYIYDSDKHIDPLLLPFIALMKDISYGEYHTTISKDEFNGKCETLFIIWNGDNYYLLSGFNQNNQPQFINIQAFEAEKIPVLIKKLNGNLPKLYTKINPSDGKLYPALVRASL